MHGGCPSPRVYTGFYILISSREVPTMNYTRRDIGKLALAALPASTLLARPNSVWGGVQVGNNVPYSFHGMSGTADKIIEYMTQLNLSACELRLQPVEAYLGAPGVYASAIDAPGGG